MAVISREHGYLFVQTPRTGCSAIAEKVLVPLAGGEHIPDADLRGADGAMLVDRKHCTLAELLEHGLLSASEAGRLLKFSSVRNPWDSMVSQYANQRTKYAGLVDVPWSWAALDPNFAAQVRLACESDFDTWLHRSFARRFPRSLKHRWHRDVEQLSWQRGMDVVLRFEHLQEDFDAVMARLGLGPFPIPRHNVSEGRSGDYRDWYTRRGRRVVESAFGDVIARFGYSF